MQRFWRKRNVNRFIAKFHLFVFFMGMLLSFAPMIVGQEDNGTPPPISVLTIKGVINPVSAEYIIDGIKNAEENDYDMLIIKMDTPGGLDDSMRDIIQKMIDTDVVIVVYVYPS